MNENLVLVLVSILTLLIGYLIGSGRLSIFYSRIKKFFS